MKATGDAFVASGLRDAGYTFIRIDGGWWGDDSSNRQYYWLTSGSYVGGQAYHIGDPRVDPTNYPGGLKDVADYLHAHGLKLGMYVSPNLSVGGSDSTAFPLPANRKGLPLIDQHASFLADGGVDHVFFDGCDFGDTSYQNAKYAGMGLTSSLDPYTRMSAALVTQGQRVGRSIAFSINSGWKGRYPQIADEWRTSADIDARWSSIVQNLGSIANPTPAGNGHWNNPDDLMVGLIDDAKAEAQMSLWCVAGAPLYIAPDLRVMYVHERFVLLNTEAIAVDQDPLRQCGSLLRTDSSGGQLWSRNLAGGARAVALFNPGASSIAVNVAWSEVGLATGPAQVRDLWAHSSLGTVNDHITVNVSAMSATFLRIVPGIAAVAEPANTWPGRPVAPAYNPLPSAGWSVTTNLNQASANSAMLLDGDPSTIWNAGQDQTAGRNCR